MHQAARLGSTSGPPLACARRWATSRHPSARRASLEEAWDSFGAHGDAALPCRPAVSDSSTVEDDYRTKVRRRAQWAVISRRVRGPRAAAPRTEPTVEIAAVLLSGTHRTRSRAPGTSVRDRTLPGRQCVLVNATRPTRVRVGPRLIRPSISGSGGRDRTDDTWLMSPLLYH